MKKLLIVRHAKSDWSLQGQTDKMRTLNERGRANAPMMGMRLKTRGEIPQRILCSTATRAEQTAKLLCAGMLLDESLIQYYEQLYHADSEAIWNHVWTAPNDVDYIMIVCHNPGITYFINDVSGGITDNVPTCGMACFEWECTSWAEVKAASPRLIFYDFPKNNME